MALMRIILAVVLFAGASSASAAGGYLVAFLDLSCGSCKALFEQEATVKNMLKKHGLTLYYVPVPQSGNAEAAWRERMYYTTRDMINEPKAKEVLGSFFEAQGEIGEQAEPLTTRSQIEAWLGLRIDGVRWRELMADAEEEGFGVDQVERAIQLFLRSRADSFPAFAVVSRGDFIPLETSGDLEQKMKQLGQALPEAIK